MSKQGKEKGKTREKFKGTRNIYAKRDKIMAK
jgi:hypothetical protein